MFLPFSYKEVVIGECRIDKQCKSSKRTDKRHGLMINAYNAGKFTWRHQLVSSKREYKTYEFERRIKREYPQNQGDQLDYLNKKSP